MRVVVDIAARIVVPGVMALLLVVAADCAAQGFGGAPTAGSMPPLALGLSNDGMRALNEQFEDDRRALDAFGGGRSSVDRFTNGGFERPKPWTLYGRVGVFGFQDQLDPSRSNGIQFRLGRTGPKLTGRSYIGIHRTF